MSKHFLALDIPDTYNPKILVIRDESEYSTDLPVDCATLEVYTPGFNSPSVLDVSTTWSPNISACALGLQTSMCGELQADLPDGIYTIRYSVAPVDKVFVEYNHLRITGIINSYNVALGSVALGTCTPEQEVVDQLRELELIKTYIDAAKIKVEDQNRPEEGLSLLLYAKKKLDKFINKCC